jgi:Na+-driven multidrug efflux pump
MGENAPERAVIYTKLIVFYTFVILSILSACWYIFRFNVAYFFTDQPELLEIVSDNTIWFALFLVVHGLGMSVCGALRGIGQ